MMSHLLRVELLDHRLKSLLGPPTAPAETSLTEGDGLIKENEESHTFTSTRSHTGTKRERIFFDGVELRASPAEGAV